MTKPKVLQRTCITFLGIEMDTIAMVLRLPPYKLQRLQQEIQQWCQRKFCTKRELQSLAGSLQHACKVVRPGRSFTRRIYEQLAQRAGPLSHSPLQIHSSGYRMVANVSQGLWRGSPTCGSLE